MAKQLDEVPATAISNKERNVIKENADDLLAQIRETQSAIDMLVNEYNVETARVALLHEEKLKLLRDMASADEKTLVKLMKKKKMILFAGTDVVNLKNGRLIHEKGEKVTIPRTALEKCKELEFKEVIKVVESLDREAIEKWPDEQLFLIGAERKPDEKFSYEVKKEKV